MGYAFGLAGALAAGWFVLSGQTKPLFLILGALSVLAALWASARLGIIDRDASPYHRAVPLVRHMGWLLVEILKSNLAVLRAIAGPASRLSPKVAATRCLAQSDLGRTLLANSITLTPGTVTLDIRDGRLMVHALMGGTLTDESLQDFSRRSAAAGDPAGGGAG